MALQLAWGREFHLDGDQLQVLIPSHPMPNWADMGETRSLISFERDAAARDGF